MTVNLKKWWVWAKNYYAQAQGKENLVINNINILIPIGLTLFIIIGHFIWSWFGDFSNGVGIVRNLVFMLASVWAFYGIIVAARRTAALEKQVKIQDRGQVAERLAKAAEQLSSTVMSVRILAILSLEKIAINGDAQICQDIINVLCAHLRDNHPANLDDKTPKQKDKYMLFPEDISHIISVLCNVNRQMSESNNAIILNLSSIDFSGVSLSGLYLAGADLTNADFSGADLSSADLSRADLGKADLEDAVLSDVKGLDTAKHLDVVKNRPQEILDEIARRNQSK